MKTWQKKLLWVAIGALCNVLLGELIIWLGIPFLYLDTIGTIFVTATLGVWPGVAVAVISHLFFAFLDGWRFLLFLLVSLTCVFITRLLSKNGFTIERVIFTGFVLSVVTTLLSIPIRFFVFDRLTGYGGDVLIQTLYSFGYELTHSTFIGTYLNNFVDKVFSCILAWIPLRFLSSRYLPSHQLQVK